MTDAADRPMDGPFDQTSLLQFMLDAVIATDLDNRITGWNRAAEELYGWSAAEAIGQPAGELLRSDYAGRQRSQLRAELQAAGFWRGELIHHHRDDHPILVLASVSLVRDSAGKPHSIVTVNRDITEQRAAEQARERARTRLQLLADASRAFTEVEADYQTVLQLVARRMVESLGDFCIIRVLADDWLFLPFAALYHYYPADT